MENNLLHKLDVLNRVDPTWQLPVFLNKQINATKWIPREYPYQDVNDIVDEIINELEWFYYDPRKDPIGSC